MSVSQASNLAARAGGDYRIGRYRVRARLGKGGMGVVYLGRDETLDRDVAIKTLRIDGAPDDESRGRFEIEAKAAARLQHPNIVTVFELGEDRGLPYIAMELLGGQDLETLVRSGERLSVTERLDIVIQTLRGLDFAHTHQIVHRDIKPSNIRVLDDGGVKILDFGIAKVESTSVTRAGMMVGTPYYMSPEHIRGGILDGRSDVFATGVILHELFAFKRPFTADDPTRVLYRIVNEAHPPLPDQAAGPLTSEVQRVIDRSLEKDADARYASAGQMADDLSRVRDRYPAAPLTDADSSAINHAKKGLAANRVASDTFRNIERIAFTNPDSSEAQRLLRLFKRKPGETHAINETSSFPELDATFGRANGGEATVVSGRTVSGRAETLLQGGAQAPAAPGLSNRIVYVALTICLLTGLVAAFLFLRQSGEAKREESGRPSEPIREIIVPNDVPATKATLPSATSPGSRPAAAVPSALLEIRSQPAGATVRVDRRSVGVTPLKTEVTANAAHVVTLSLVGYQSKDVRIDVPLPRLIDSTLTADGPPGTLVVESAYPVTVTVSGHVIAAEKSGATTTLPAGSHDVLVESAAVFLKHRETVQLSAGASFTITAPGTGKLSVRANPDNCKISVDGVFVDYPPILDRTIAAGSHVISFEWPDGAKSEERTDIQAGKPSYVLGRKR